MEFGIQVRYDWPSALYQTAPQFRNHVNAKTWNNATPYIFYAQDVITIANISADISEGMKYRVANLGKQSFVPRSYERFQKQK